MHVLMLEVITHNLGAGMPEDPMHPKPNADTNPDSQQEQALANVESQNVADTGESTHGQQGMGDLGAPMQPKKSKKALLIGLIVAGVLAVLGGGSALAYTFWYQNPEKVVMDGLVGAMTARTANVDGTMAFVSKDADFTMTLSNRGGMQDGAMMSAKMAIKDKTSGSTIELEGDGIYAQNGDVYFRVKKAKQALDTFSAMIVDQMAKSYQEQGQELPKEAIEQMQAYVTQLIQPIVAKIDNQWVKVSVEDMKKVDAKSSEEYKCTQDTTKKLYTDKQTIDQIVAMYYRNKFLIIKEQLGNKNGSLGYVIDIDNGKSDSFGKEFEQLPAYKELLACSKAETETDTKDDAKTDDTSATGRVELWIDQWSHSITRIKGDATMKVDGEESKFTMDFATKFNQPARVTLPGDAITIDQLSKEMEDILDTVSGSEQESASARA